MAEPYTIQIFVPDGDPEGVKIIERRNWTGKGIVFPRDKWTETRSRPELASPGVYILRGYESGEEDLPTLYIGEGDGISSRIESHTKTKDFWDWGICFVSNGSLNKAHVQWLEYALVQQAKAAGRCRLENGNAPQEPALSESDKADMKAFLKQVLQILPLAGLQAFERPKAVVPGTAERLMVAPLQVSELDTVIVPARGEGFDSVFLGEHCWYAIRISGGMLDKIKWIAAYQSAPVSAITHVAPVARIEPYGEDGKYKVIFAQPASPVGPIAFGDAPSGAMQGPRYTSYSQLAKAKTVSELTRKTA